MAPPVPVQPAIMARATSMSAGAIAGTVVGAVVGGTGVLLVLGFIFFFLRRRSREAKEKWENDAKERASWQGHHPELPFEEFHPEDRPRSRQLSGLNGNDKHLEAGPNAVPSWDSQPRQRGSPTQRSLKDTEAFGSADAEPYACGHGQPDEDESSPVREQGPATLSAGPIGTHEAANRSYYDLSVPMDSDSETETMGPTEQMAALYKEQLKKARAYHREHRQGSGATVKKIITNFGKHQKRSGTMSSNRGPSSSSASSTPQQYAPSSPASGPGSARDRGADAPPVPMLPSGGQAFFAEPEELPGATGSDADETHSRQRQGRQDTHRFTWRRGDSTRDDSIRETTEMDPDLPSSALGSGPSRGLPPGSAARAPTSTQPHQERLTSPDIPEPMQIDTTAHFSQAAPPSSSQQPQPLPIRTNSYGVSPMAVMQPSNATEKAAFTDYQIENSASPPATRASSDPPQETSHTQQCPPAPEPPELNMDDFVAFDDAPSGGDARQSAESLDYSTPPQSATDFSSGRTPDTRLTGSPSPVPYQNMLGFRQPAHETESSASPESARLSPNPGASLNCDECGRSFDHLHKLNHHKRYHDRKHNCPYESCDKKFGTKTHLDRHINDKHLKSKAYHCTDPSCAYFKGGKSFPRKDNWRRHMIKKHQAEPDKLEAMDESIG